MEIVGNLFFSVFNQMNPNDFEEEKIARSLISLLGPKKPKQTDVVTVKCEVIIIKYF